jgi:hypothetical protein
MLSVNHIAGFNESLGQAQLAADEVDIPDRFVDRYKLLEIASKSIRDAHTQLTAIIGQQGGAPSEILFAYNQALDEVRVPIQEAFDERNEDAGTSDVPDLPPRAVPTATGTTKGLGLPVEAVFSAMKSQPGFVPVSDIRFVHSSTGEVGTLRDAMLWDAEARDREAYIEAELEEELGELGLLPALVAIAVIAGVAFIAWQIVKTMRRKYTEATKQENARTKAAIVRTKAEVAKAITSTQQEFFLKCEAKAKNAAEVQQCATKANAAAKAAGDAAAKAQPKVPPGPKKEEKGMGLFGWIGVITVVAGASVGGYLLYRHRREVRAARTVRHAKAARPALPAARAVEAEEAEIEFTTLPRAKARFRRKSA